MAATREDVIEFLKSMTLLEASQLVKDLEETFGVSAAAAAVAAPVAAAGGIAYMRSRRLSPAAPVVPRKPRLSQPR